MIVLAGCSSTSAEANEYFESVGQALREVADQIAVCSPVHPSEEPDCTEIDDNDPDLAFSLENLRRVLADYVPDLLDISWMSDAHGRLYVASAFYAEVIHQRLSAVGQTDTREWDEDLVKIEYLKAAVEWYDQKK